MDLLVAFLLGGGLGVILGIRVAYWLILWQEPDERG